MRKHLPPPVETATCEVCGGPMPRRRSKDGLLRRFCKKRCSWQRSQKITINHDQASLPKTPKTSWWVGLAESPFYEKARELFPSEPAPRITQKGWGS